MPNVVFAAPHSMETTNRFVQAVAELPGVRLGLVSHEAVERLPGPLRDRLAAHWRVDDVLDPAQLAWAVRSLGERLGRVERLVGTLEELQVPLAEVREALGIAGLGAEAARNFRDKSRMKDVLRAHGIPCARHRLCDTAAECRAFTAECGYPVVVKPPAGAGARNTFRVESADQLEEWLAATPPRAGAGALLEEFIVGDEHSFDSVVVDGRLAWHSISRYYPTPLEVLRHPWIQWCVLLPREIEGGAYDAIRDAGARALAALGLRTGLSHMEWFRRGDGSVAISEVGARPPGAQFTTLLSYAHDTDLYRAWAMLAVYDAFEPPPRRWAVGAAYLRGQGRGRIVAVHGLDEAQRDLGGLVVEARLPRPGDAPRGTYEGDGYVILRHPETAVVERALARLVTTIRVELG